MLSKPVKHKSKRIRHRITEIALRPTTSSRQISAKVLVDNDEARELPWIKGGQPLRWTKLIVYDTSDNSKVTLEVCEKHSIKDRRFRSKAYVVSSVQQQTEIIVGFVGSAWNATFKLLTPAAAEQSFAAGIDKLREIQSAPSTLERLGRARPLFKAMLQFGSEVSEAHLHVHPAAKTVFMICTKTWEALEAQEECNENVQELLDGLGGILDFVEMIKKHAQTERLQETIGDFLILLEDVSICVADRVGSTRKGRTLRGLLDPDSKDHGRVKSLLSRFERLRAELIIGIGAETHKQVHAIGQKVQTMDLYGLLSQLQPVHPSGYDPSRACLEGTREGIISNIILWTEQSTAQECMLWIHGQAGIGKSSIATSVCLQLANKGVLAASFFCQRNDPSLRDPLRLINSITHSLASRHPLYGQAVATAIQEHRELCTAHMDVRYEGLIKKPIQSLEDTSMSRPLIILVDALDECGTYDTRRNLLVRLSDLSKLVPWLKVIVTSRSDGDIQRFIQSSNKSHVSSRNVHDFDASDDIRAYIQKELGEIARKHRWDEGSIDLLCEKASGVFIWAATVKNYLTGFRGSTIPRLQKVLYDQKSTVSDHLDTLYRSVILAGMPNVEEDQKAVFRQCIGALAIASTRQPLPIVSLSSLLQGQLDPITLEEVVNSLDAVLHVDEHLDGAVRFYHPSFADYATDSSRSADLYVFPEERNVELAMGCLMTMERGLRFNICELETAYLLNSQVPDLAERIKLNISDHLNYACTYWISHLIDTPRGTLMNEVEALMSSPRVLFWLEALSVLGRVEIGLQGLLELQEWLPEGEQKLSECIEDMYRFTLAFYDPISSSAPHLYVSALALAPSSAQVVRRFGHLFPNTVTVTSRGDIDWPRWLRTLAHPTDVYSLTVSSDGRLLVTGSEDGAVRIWDIRSGTMIGGPLFSDLGFARCVALSSDGTRIVSGHLGRALQLWDAENGVAFGEPLEGHFNIVYCVAFSPDDKLIVSGSVDETLRLWDANTGASVGHPLVGHCGTIGSVAFSPDGGYIVSSSPIELRIWATATMEMIGQLIASQDDMICAVFSNDGNHILYGSSAGIGAIQWDPIGGTMIGEPLLQHSCRVSSLAFSPDGHRVVYSTGSTLHIWDVEADTVVGEPLTGHFGYVRSVAFLPGGHRIASASQDKTVRLWDARSRYGTTVSKPLIGHSGNIVSVAFSSGGDRIASAGSQDNTLRLWDAKTGAAAGDPLVHPDGVPSVTFSADDKFIVSASYDNKLHIWNSKTGVSMGKPLSLNSCAMRPIIFSPDGTHIIFGSIITASHGDTLTVTSVVLNSDPYRIIFDPENIVQMSDATTSIEPSNHLTSIATIALSPDGSSVASGTWGGMIHLWNAKTGMALTDPIVGHSDVICSLAFSPDSSSLVSGSQDKTLRLWDTRLCIAIGEPLVGHSGAVSSLAFSPDGTQIVSGSRDNTLRLWDCNTGAAIGNPFAGHTKEITSVAFSPDGSHIVSGSEDGSVRVWNAKLDIVDIESDPEDSSYSTHHTVPTTGASWPPHTYALPPHPEHRGWASLDDKSLLLWLPVRYRREYSPKMIYTISTDASQSTIRLDFSRFAHGSSWANVACDNIRRNLA